MTDRLFRYSETSTFLESRMRYRRKYIEKLERIYPNSERPMLAMDVGTIGHKGLEAYYKGKPLDVARRAMRFQAHSLNVYDSEKHTKQGAYDAFERYISWLQVYNPDKNYKIIAVEERLYVDMGEILGDRVTLTFEPDLVIQDQFNLMHVIDHKLVDRFANMRSFITANSQGLSYALGFKLLGQTIHSFTLNQIRRSVPKKPTTAFVPVDRATFWLSPDILERWEVYLRRVLHDMVQMWQDIESGDYSSSYPHATFNCANMCNIYEICCGGIAKDPKKLADEIRTEYRTKDTTL